MRPVGGAWATDHTRTGRQAGRGGAPPLTAPRVLLQAHHSYGAEDPDMQVFASHKFLRAGEEAVRQEDPEPPPNTLGSSHRMECTGS